MTNSMESGFKGQEATPGDKDFHLHIPELSKSLKEFKKFATTQYKGLLSKYKGTESAGVAVCAEMLSDAALRAGEMDPEVA